MKPRPGPKIFGHLEMNAAIKGKVIVPDQARIFRQRFSEWLCKASSGPCDFPGRKEFFQEIELNPEQQRQLLKALEEVLRETGIPETNQQELLSKLSNS